MPTTSTFTDEQYLALSAHDRSVALSAGAGCGKTFVLTERFLSYLDPRILEPTAELDELVAITFTEAAAREMRDRIRLRCYERMSAATEGQQKQAWQRLLRILDTARISTIHSFCATLLRSHAVEAQLDPRFEQLDSTSADLLRLRTVDQRLRQLLLEKDESVIQLATRFGLRSLREHLLNLLGDDLTPILSRWQEATPEELIAEWKAYFTREITPLASSEFLASDPVREVRRLCASGEFAADELHAHCQIILELFEELPKSKDPAKLLGKLRELAKATGPARKKNWHHESDYEQYRDSCKDIREKVIKNSILFKPWNEEQLQDAAQLGLALLALADDLARCYEMAKQNRNVLDFEDLMHKAHRLLTAPEFADVQQEISRSTKLLLVDEFQDTDPLQVAIVKALCGQQWADSGLFVVGDAKQSIYRFRGAQPEVSRSLREQLPEASRLSLTTNFRSQGAVLDFVNALFCDAFVEEYKPLRPSRKQLTPLPAIEFLWAPADTEDDDSIPLQLAGVERERFREARFIAQRLAGLIDSGQPLVVEGESPRPVKQGDIAILLRTLSNVQVYEEALREQGLDYYLAGGHAFYAQQEVYDVLHLLRSVSNQADELSLAGALRSPLFGLEDETLFWLVNKRNSLHAALFSPSLPQEITSDEQTKVLHAARILQELRNRKDELLVAELLTLAIELTGYDAVLRSEFLGERKLANLYKLVEQAHTIDELSPGDLSGFVTQLSEFVARAPKEPVAATTAEGDVIRIMTIHNAKGLEFPLVVVPDLERKSHPTSAQPVFHEKLGPLVKPNDDSCAGWNLYQLGEKIEEEAEKIRLLYVACTRAADYLILSSSIKDLAKPASFWTKFLAERFDLASGRCLVTLPPGYATPQIYVSTSEPTSNRQRSSRARGADLEKLVEKVRKLAKSAGGVIPEGVAPISVHRKARKSFSFSRISGQLKKKVERELLDADETPIDVSYFDPRGFGTLVHAVLEQCSFVGPQPVNSEILELCQFLAPAHMEQNANAAAHEAAELVQQFWQSDRARKLASARCLLKELDFILPGELISDSLAGRHLEGIIDCLYQDEAENWHILDYKTNRVTAEGLQVEAEQYEMQMFVYGLACEHAIGVKPSESVLYFLRPGLEYTSQQSAADRASHVQQILRAIAELDSSE